MGSRGGFAPESVSSNDIYLAVYIILASLNNPQDQDRATLVFGPRKHAECSDASVCKNVDHGAAIRLRSICMTNATLERKGILARTRTK